MHKIQLKVNHICIVFICGITLLFLPHQLQARSRSDTNLTVVYHDSHISSPLTSKELNRINSRLKKNKSKYKSATLYIDFYPKKGLVRKTNKSNYQLVITARDGCLIQSKIMYMDRKRLASAITAKIQQLIDTWWRISNQTSVKPKHVSKISNI